jgi:hypothetical protein
MPPIDPVDPLAALHALPEDYQRAIREAYRVAMFRWLDRLAVKANEAAAREAAHESEPNGATTSVAA